MGSLPHQRDDVDIAQDQLLEQRRGPILGSVDPHADLPAIRSRRIDDLVAVQRQHLLDQAFVRAEDHLSLLEPAGD